MGYINLDCYRLGLEGPEHGIPATQIAENEQGVATWTVHPGKEVNHDKGGIMLSLDESAFLDPSYDQTGLLRQLSIPGWVSEQDGAISTRLDEIILARPKLAPLARWVLLAVGFDSPSLSGWTQGCVEIGTVGSGTARNGFLLLRDGASITVSGLDMTSRIFEVQQTDTSLRFVACSRPRAPQHGAPKSM